MGVMGEAKANNVVEKVYFSSSDKMHSIFFFLTAFR